MTDDPGTDPEMLSSVWRVLADMGAGLVVAAVIALLIIWYVLRGK